MNRLCVEYTVNELSRLRDAISYEGSVSGPMAKVLQLKNRFRIFDNISDADLIQIISDVEIQKFAKDEAIIQENSISEEMFFILIGECGISVNSKSVGYLRSGQIFGEVAAIFKKPRNATVVSTKANTTTLSFKINHDSRSTYTDAFVELYKNIANELVLKLESSNNG